MKPLLNKFGKKADGTYLKDSEDSLRYISCAIFATMMGHFETYQRSLFSGLIERSSFFPSFETERFLNHFEKNCGGELSVSTARLMAFRMTQAPVGFVVADSLKSWYSPRKVNSYFKAFGCKQDLFGSQEISDLEILWQLRHSIVHTGAWITIPDAQKVKRLKGFGGKAIVLDTNFVNGVSRRFHKMVKDCNKRLLADCQTLLGTSPDPKVKDDFEDFLKVVSPKNAWL